MRRCLFQLQNLSYRKHWFEQAHDSALSGLCLVSTPRSPVFKAKTKLIPHIDVFESRSSRVNGVCKQVLTRLLLGSRPADRDDPCNCSGGPVDFVRLLQSNFIKYY